MAADWELPLHLLGGHPSPETVLAAPLGPCMAATKFPCVCQGSGCWAVVLG